MWIVAVLALFAQAPADPFRSIEKLIAAGEYRNALATLEKQPDTFERHLLASKAHDGLNDPAHAVAEAEAALQFQPRSEAAHLQLGQIFLSRNTPQAALDIFTEALSYHPGSYLLHAGRGLALKDLTLYEDAEKELTQCLKRKPAFGICFDGLATVYLHTKRFADLAEISARHQQAAPGDYRGPYFAAVAANALNAAPSEVRKSLERSIKINPNFAASHALLGRLHLRNNELAAAIQSLETAARLRPDYPPALLNLAQAYKRANRDADANRAFEMLRQANERERQGKPALIFHRGKATDNQ